MNKINTKTAIGRTTDVVGFYGQATAEPALASRDGSGNRFETNELRPESGTCKTKSLVQIKIEEFQFQIARGWLDSRMAAHYLGIKIKTLYNLKSRALIKPEGKHKSIYRLAELDRVLKGLK